MKLSPKGGGIYSRHSSIYMNNVSISNNEAHGYQGGGFGGGIYCDGNDISFENLIIRENKAIGNGGGVFFRGRSCIFKNVVIANNETENIEIITGVYTNYQGAGLALEGYEIDLVNITITENFLIGPNQQPFFSGGVAIWTSMSDVSIINSIIVNNYPCNINQNNNTEYLKKISPVLSDNIIVSKDSTIKSNPQIAFNLYSQGIKIAWQNYVNNKWQILYKSFHNDTLSSKAILIDSLDNDPQITMSIHRICDSKSL